MFTWEDASYCKTPHLGNLLLVQCFWICRNDYLLCLCSLFCSVQACRCAWLPSSRRSRPGLPSLLSPWPRPPSPELAWRQRRSPGNRRRPPARWTRRRCVALARRLCRTLSSGPWRSSSCWGTCRWSPLIAGWEKRGQNSGRAGKRLSE